MGERVRDEVEEIGKGLAAENLARDVKELDTNPLGHQSLFLTAFENHSTAFEKKNNKKTPMQSLNSTPHRFWLNWFELEPGHWHF